MKLKALKWSAARHYKLGTADWQSPCKCKYLVKRIVRGKRKCYYFASSHFITLLSNVNHLIHRAIFPYIVLTLNHVSRTHERLTVSSSRLLRTLFANIVLMRRRLNEGVENRRQTPFNNSITLYLSDAIVIRTHTHMHNHETGNKRQTLRTFKFKIWKCMSNCATVRLRKRKVWWDGIITT